MTDEPKPERVYAVPPEDLRPWGWAPGGYAFQCIDCPHEESFFLKAQGAKRSSRCRDHAIAAWNTRAAPQEPAAVLEGEAAEALAEFARSRFADTRETRWATMGEERRQYFRDAVAVVLSALHPTASASEGEVNQAAKAICRTMPGPECFGTCRACLKSAHAALSARLAAPDTTAALREARLTPDAIQGIELVCAEEGATVTLTGSNPDFNGLPNEAVTIACGASNWEDITFRGDTLTECIVAAVSFMADGEQALATSQTKEAGDE